MSEREVLAIAATFTAEPVEEVLDFWAAELGLDWQIEFAPFGQVFQQLLDPASLLRRNQVGLNIVLVRLEDWQRPGEDGAPEVVELARALQAAAEHSPVPHLVCLCPPSRAALGDPGRAVSLAASEERLARALVGAPNLELVRSSELAARYPVCDYDDPQGERLGAVPYTQEFFAALGTLLARTVYRLRARPAKVVALDCDETLWGGVCGEVEPRELELDAGRRALQEFVVARQREGMLLCLCSKNNEEDVWRVFDERADMALRREHLVGWRLNWQSKSQNLRELAAELGLGLESFVLLDDDPVACAEVAASCPEVLALQLPTNRAEYPAFLEHVWALDRADPTPEDEQRTALYRQAAKREQVRRAAPSFAEFLAGLALDVAIAPAAPEQVGRVSQLTQRTNQFNLAPVRRTEAEVRHLLQSGDLECRVVDVSDRFGKYGLVGVLLFRLSAETLEVDTFLLSCRALGRGVEHQMLAELGRLALAAGVDRVELPFRVTEQNRPARDFLEALDVLEALGGELSSGTISRLGIPARSAAGLRFSPAETPAADTHADTHATVNVDGAASDAGRAGPVSAVLGRVACDLRTPRQVLDAVERRRARSRPARTGYVAPSTALESALAGIWSAVLGVQVPGVLDDFFESGGHSLLAALLVARASDAFGVELNLLELFDAPSIAGLAAAVEQRQLELADPAAMADALRELAELSDDEVAALLADGGGAERGS